MTHRKLVLGLVCLSTLCFGVLETSNASALTMHECKKAPQSGQTAQQYTDSECTSKGTGEYREVPIGFFGTFFVVGTSTANTDIAANVAGIKFKVTCTTQEGSGTAENTESGGTNVIAGIEFIKNYSGCTVTEPAGKGCTVANPINTAKATLSTNGMKAVFAPESGTKFATITVSGCVGGFAALNGAKEVTGTATGEVQESTPRTLKFTSTSGSALKFAGQAATFTTSEHYCTFSIPCIMTAWSTP